MVAGALVIKTIMDNSKFQSQYKKIYSEVESLQEMYESFANGEIDLSDEEVEEIVNRVGELDKQLDEIVAKEKESNRLIEKTGKSLGSNIKQIGRMALGIFGIRSAYSAITSAISRVSQYNDDIKNKIEFAKVMLATAIEPVVVRIVDLFYKLLTYVNYLVRQLTGKDLFSDANKNLQKANKSATALRKTLAGFDEMNILNGNGSVGTLGGLSSGMEAPNIEIPGWLKWIVDNKEIALSFFAGLTAGVIALKNGFGLLSTVVIALVTSGIVLTLEGIYNFINDPSIQNFGTILEGIGIAITGIGIAILGVQATNPVGWITLAVGALIGLIGVLFSDRDAIKSVEQANRDLYDARLALNNSQKSYTEAIKKEEKAYKDLKKVMKDNNIDQKELSEIIEIGDRNYKDLNETQRKVYDAYLNLQIAQGNVKDAEEKLTEAKKQEAKDSIAVELANGKEADSYEKLKDKVVEAYEKGYITAGEASTYISQAMANMSTDTYKTFVEDIPNAIKSGLDPFKYKSPMSKLKDWWNGEIEKFRREITLKPTASDLIISVTTPGKKTFAKGGMYYPNLPKLAVGGIVNQPGRGIPYHGAIVGERGAEAVMPLTDSQQMEILGATIGKYITVNATIENSMNGRIISRELAKVQSQSDFASNR